jgi:transposase
VDIRDRGREPREDGHVPRASKYPPEFRAHAVELYRTSGKSQRAIALELGISNEILRGWIRQADLDEGRRSDGVTTTEREELRRLRAEARPLRMARDLLKKAAAFFARESDRTR